MFRRHVLVTGAAAALAVLAPAAATAADPAFPGKPVRMVVGSAAGALLDVSTRAFAERMAIHLGQPVVVENMAGASSALAARHVAKAAPDGYTLLTAANTLLTTPHLMKSAGYGVGDFAAVGEMARSPSLLVVGGASPFRSLQDLVAAARQKPKAVVYASGGIGTTSHLPVVLLSNQAGLDLVHVPYKGVSQVVPDVASGRVEFTMGTATSFAELIRAGRLRVLAITSSARSAQFPAVPTFVESGYPEVTFEIWVGVFAPAATPPAIRARLADAMNAARADPRLRAQMEAHGQEISPSAGPEAFGAYVAAEDRKYRKLIVDAKIVAE